MSEEPPNVGSPGDALLGATAITPTMVHHLQKTGPWVRLVSIFGLVIGVIVGIVGVLAALVNIATKQGGDAIAAVPMLFACVLAGGLYFFPSLHLLRYASAIKQLRGTIDAASLEVALFHQRRFWRWVGIATIVLICVYAAIIFVAVVVGIVRAFK